MKILLQLIELKLQLYSSLLNGRDRAHFDIHHQAKVQFKRDMTGDRHLERSAKKPAIADVVALHDELHYRFKHCEHCGICS